MPDISMCLNDACPLAKDCYRHEAEPKEYGQSYADFKPDADGNCEKYLPINQETNETKLH